MNLSNASKVDRPNLNYISFVFYTLTSVIYIKIMFSVYEVTDNKMSELTVNVPGFLPADIQLSQCILMFTKFFKRFDCENANNLPQVY